MPHHRYYPTYDPDEAWRASRSPIVTFADLDAARQEADRLATSEAFHNGVDHHPLGYQAAHVFDFAERRVVYRGVIRPELFAAMGADEDESAARLDRHFRGMFGERFARDNRESPHRRPHWTERVACIEQHLATQ